MPNYQPRDIVLISFPFTNLKNTKKRPALVLLNVGDGDVLVARITGKVMDTDFDVKITEWKQVGLILPSIVRLNKLGTIDESVIEKKLGAVHEKDWNMVQIAIKKLLERIGEV